MDEESINTNTASLAEQTRFLILVRSVEGERHTRLLIESPRTFGGRLRDCPVLVFLPNPASVSHTYPGIENVHFVPLMIEDQFRHYFFGDKVYACAVAEGMVGKKVRSLVWLSPQCLIVNPPVLFDLSTSFDAAMRPVHIKNVGSSVKEPLDDFWKEIYRTVGIDKVSFAVESFVDSQKLRPYFNTHAFAINPSLG